MATCGDESPQQGEEEEEEEEEEGEKQGKTREEVQRSPFSSPCQVLIMLIGIIKGTTRDITCSSHSPAPATTMTTSLSSHTHTGKEGEGETGGQWQLLNSRLTTSKILILFYPTLQFHWIYGRVVTCPGTWRVWPKSHTIFVSLLLTRAHPMGLGQK